MKVLLFLLLLTSFAFAHDKHYAVSEGMKQWFDTLRSKSGPCCSDADGDVLQDADWDAVDGHYRVRLDGKWMVVPDGAVIQEPNRYGPTMVWPIRQHGFGYGYSVKSGEIVDIRCFMPGSMT